jgi:hypothetical protein
MGAQHGHRQAVDPSAITLVEKIDQPGHSAVRDESFRQQSAVQA